MRIKYIFLIVGIVSTLTLIAQEQETKTYKNYFGFNAGFTTGLGYAYAYWPGKFGAQITFMPVVTNDQSFISIALTPFYTLIKSKHTKGYLFLGNHVVSNKEDTKYNIGFGPGIEVGSRVVFSMRGGIGFYDITDTFSMLPTIDIGLYFKF